MVAKRPNFHPRIIRSNLRSNRFLLGFAPVQATRCFEGSKHYPESVKFAIGRVELKMDGRLPSDKDSSA